MAELLYSWSFDSKKQRGNLWYIIVLSVAIGLIIWGFLSKQFGMSFVIIILSGLVFYVENNSEDIVQVQITSDGIKIDKSFYPFSHLTNYGIIYEGENAIILRLIIAKKIGIGTIDVNINNNVAGDIRNILSNFLEETNKQEFSFGEKIIRLLKL